MSMEEVNERFPLTKYKVWTSTREAEGLPSAGGVTAPPSRAASLKNEMGTIDEDARPSDDTARPNTAIEMAQQDHMDAVAGNRPTSPDTTEGASSHETSTLKEHDETPAATEDAPPPVTAARNESGVTIDEEEEDEDDPIRTAAPPEMLAVPGDTCAICLDSLEDDDDVRGLTCGHAFHASCVDPWLTSRRACCPLCKADYYVPKPRAEGEEDSGRRPTPNHPQAVWIRGRPGMGFSHPRMMFGGPRWFLNDDNHRLYSSTPARQERRRRERDAPDQNPASEGQQQQASPSDSWRSRLPTMPSVHMPRFGRRAQQPATGTGTTSDGNAATPSNLEAGTVS